MKRLISVVAGCVLLSFPSSARAQTKDKQVCARKLTVALEPPNPAAAEVLLKQGYSECGDGHGFLAAMAMAAAATGDLGRAADLCVRELSEDNSTDRAVDGFVMLFPRVSPTTRRKMLQLGTTPEAPINLRTPINLAHLVEHVYCEGLKVIGQREAYDKEREQFRVDIECPRGTVTTRYVRYPIEELPTGPGARRYADRLIEELALGPKFGTGTAAELRERVAGPSTADRSLAWLLGSIPDPLRTKGIWAQLVKQNPNDLEAIVSLAANQVAAGELDQALKTLRAADAKKVEVLDTRGVGSPSALLTLECSILRRQNKLAEAAAACTRALAMGSKRNGPLVFAEVLYLQGKYEAALAQVESSLAMDGRSQRGYVVAALINQKLGRLEAAKTRFDGSYGLSVALGASLEDKRTPAEWVALLDRFDERQAAYSLAQGGHVYLDLDLPKLSRACFAASEKIEPFAAKVTRLEHLAETDPRAALTAADGLLSQARDAQLLRVVARARAHAGAPHDGIPALRESLYRTAPWEMPEELIRTVCVEEPLEACMKLRK